MITIDTHIKLSELTHKIRQVIDEAFGAETYWIVAEISGHKMYQQGERHYFEFVEKDEESEMETAKVRGIAWRMGSDSIRDFERMTGQTFKDGIEVLARVKVEYSGKYGLSLILIEIDKNWTLGNLEKQKQATLARLVAENPDAIQLVDEEYITINKKARFGAVIQHIAVIGSPNSAGYKDFEGIIHTNRFHYQFVIDTYQSAVQGEGAPGEIVNRLVSIYQSGKKYDAVVIIRGGGAKTDFLVFNNYLLAKAVARFPIPIITGIGHLIDTSIVDMMVNTTTNTPTKAAEFIVSHNRHFEDQVIRLQNIITIKSQQLLANSLKGISAANLNVINKTRSILDGQRDSLQSLSRKISTKPQMMVSHQSRDLVNLIANLKSFSHKYFTFKKGMIAHQESMIRMARPESILKRGFAIVKKNGRPVGNAENIQPEDQLSIIMTDYDLDTKVETKRRREDGESYL